MQSFRTPKRVLLADKVATVLISIVGMGVIFAVLGLLFFLVQTVLPLGTAEKIQKGRVIGPATAAHAYFREPGTPAVLRLSGEPQRGCQLELLSVDQGKVMTRFGMTTTPEKQFRLAPGVPPPQTLTCQGNGSSSVIVRQELSDKKIALTRVELAFEKEFVSEASARELKQAIVQSLNQRGFAIDGETIYVKTSKTAPIAKLVPALNTRETFLPNMGAPYASAAGMVSHEFDFASIDESSSFLIVRSANGEIVDTFFLKTTKNEITGESSSEQISIPQAFLTQKSRVIALAPANQDHAILFHADGSLSQLSLDSLNPESNVLTHVSVAGFTKLATAKSVFGSNAFFLDDGNGKCAVVDLTAISRRFASDNVKLAVPTIWTKPCRESRENNALLLANPRMRAILRITDNHLQGFDTTTGRELFDKTFADLKEQVSSDAAPLWEHISGQQNRFLTFSASGSELLLVSSGQLFTFEFLAPHIEASAKTYFGKLMYEGYDSPSFTWQSTSGAEGFQPKLSLVPLIWGTLKACLYSMLFAIPMGIFAAIYSSEFLDRQTRNFVKPTVEMMASLPSVVLGFMAAIVIAPWIEQNVLSVMIIIILLPFMLFLLGSIGATYSARHISAKGLYASKRLLMWLVLGSIASAVALLQAGRMLEHTAFGGDIKNYLAGGPGSEGALWGVLLLPAVLTLFWSAPFTKRRKTYRTAAFLCAPACSLLVGLIISTQTDIRGSMLGAYAQRNTLVIAIAMGFAIIPIIYSISEDALTAVPSSLRAASLACGASVWQTTARVVLPTAASGIFSAIVVGLGRAIGETMIVVMAAGNTPVMSVNPFDGLRSLSANIAIELPEAAHGSTHYRTLFLSALLLFGFTFALNSLAEVIRMKYRERNKAL